MKQEPTPDLNGSEKMAAAMMTVAETMEPVLEQVAGYRARCESLGFNAAVSDQMTIEFHGMLLELLTEGQS